MDAVRTTFIKSVPAWLFVTHETPSVKSLRDQYMHLKERHSTAVRQMEPLSENIETVCGLDVLPDDLILKKHKFEENQRVERDDQIAREQQLITAGETICQLEISRKRRNDNVDDVTEDCSSRKTTMRASKSLLEDVFTYIVKSVEQQKASKEKKMALEEEEFIFDNQCAEMGEKRFQRIQEVAERKRDLDEKRFGLEDKYREERSHVERERNVKG